ncbi:hypothetical protein Gohar_011472, partial [Gossypium harknessii]|nr:hypothetical protein [Gossypium harknessii]
SEVVRELKQGVQGDNGDGDVNGNTVNLRLTLFEECEAEERVLLLNEPACSSIYVEKVYLVLDQIENFIIYHLGLVAAVFLKWVGPFFIDKMDLLTSSLLCPLLVWLLLQAFNSIINGSKSSQQKLPPGPRRMPIIGNLIDLGDKPHRSLAKLAQIHGPVMSLKLSSLITVVVSSETMAKE